MTNLIKSCSVSKTLAYPSTTEIMRKTAQGAAELKMNRILTVARINASEQYKNKLQYSSWSDVDLVSQTFLENSAI